MISATSCQQAAGKVRETNTPVVSIAAIAEAEITRFWEMVQLWEEEPKMRDDVGQESLTAWEDIPIAFGFRVAQPRENGALRRATTADKTAQQQKYAKCLAWAPQCGLTDDQFQANLRAVPTDKHQCGVADLPDSLRSRECSSREHARLLCVNHSICSAASYAGSQLGGETAAA